MARDKTRSKAAYFLVDVSELPADIKAEVLEDANAGGGEFGLRIVEAIHNGPAQQMIYGVYYGPDEDKWNEAKKDLGITSTSIADSRGWVRAPVPDPLREAAIRQKPRKKQRWRRLTASAPPTIPRSMRSPRTTAAPSRLRPPSAVN
jgi:hypothetical protein